LFSAIRVREDWLMVGFQILVLEGRDLIAADRGGTSDPYLVISIPEHPAKTWKTGVVKKTLNPVWNEVFSIPVAPKVPSPFGLH
jgi:Ca2+-dependent lipid-binding protein